MVCLIFLTCAGSKNVSGNHTGPETKIADFKYPETIFIQPANSQQPQPAAIQAQYQADSETTGLNAALGDFSQYVTNRLANGTFTAMADINTPAQRLGNYIADKLTDFLLNDSGLRLVSRQDFERILREQNVQASAYFNDDTTAKLGHTLGWQTIITGAVEPMLDAYHLSLRAVNVETGELQGSKSYILNSGDPVLINLVNPDIAVENLIERESILTPFDGGSNDFELRISINKNLYYDGEFLFITLHANMDCFFVAYHLDVNNKMQVIFPNPYEKDTNYLLAGRPRVIPENSYFLLHAPYGEERILVYASDRPIAIPDEQYQARSLTRDYIADPDALWHGARGISVQSSNATRQISYTILPR